MVYYNAATQAGKSARVGHTFAGWRSDRERRVSFTALAQAGVARAVFYENAAVNESGHARQVALGLDILADAIVPWALLKEGVLPRLEL